MSININPGNITAVFNNLFEKGSKGLDPNTVDQPGPKESPALTPSAGVKKFQGYIKKSGEKICLETLGGGEFILVNLKEDLLKNYQNEIVTVSGRQVADTIENPKIIFGQQAPKKTSSATRLPAQLNRAAESAGIFLKKYKDRIPGLLHARPGYKYVNGEITNTVAITAIVEKKKALAALPDNQRLPENFDGFDVEVVTASPKDQLRFRLLKTEEEKQWLQQTMPPSMLDIRTAEEAELLEAGIPANNYIPPAHVQLEEITGPMTLVCHVSPDAGWKTLRPFLDDTNEHLQIGIYDFSAPQLFETLKTVARRSITIKLVYDGNPAAGVGEGSKEDDVQEQTIINSLKRISGGNFEFVKAWKGKNGICSNAYHIKVAVKDQKSFWLSSGNWQTSNQPNIDFEADIASLPNFNREWNMIVDNSKLASIYHKFIDWDFERSNEKPEAEMLESMVLPELFIMEEEVEERAETFSIFPSRKFVFTRNKPLRMQPVLSPDNYMEHASQVIRSATSTLYFQNQYINISKEITTEYEELLQLLADKSNDDSIDCKIILRKPFSTADKMEMFDNLKAMGFNMSVVRLMKNTHTKGIIADSKTLLLGSHNWSNSGVQFNRDASLVIYNEEVARYYEEVFLHDWNKRTIRERMEEEVVMLDEGQETALFDSNFKKVNWKEYLE